MPMNAVVDQDTWIAARKNFMAKEKDFQRARDALSEERRALPWMKITKDYRFQGDCGEVTLDDLFEGRSQLIVWHFMFGADWEAGCKSCSFWADSYDRSVVHLNARDVSLAVVSTAPIETLADYKARMGWSFTWVSAGENGFNQEFAVTFSEDQVSAREPLYNFGTLPAFVDELPGMSVFVKGNDGAIYRTYSTYARGLDPLNAAYQQLDLVPKGRDEGGQGMAWLRRRDEYETA